MSGKHRVVSQRKRTRNITALTLVAGTLGSPAMASPLRTPPVEDAPVIVPKLNVYADGIVAAPNKTSGKLQPLVLKSQTVIPALAVTDEGEHTSLTAQSLSAFQQSVEDMRPTVARPAEGAFTSGFGPRWGTFHAGVDIANSIGTPIYAVMSGVVIDSGPASGYGNWIRIRHEDGAVSTYGHMETLQVSKGDVVEAGEQIATMGNRGFSTGPHLHFEIAPNGSTAVDPAAWLAARGITL